MVSFNDGTHRHQQEVLSALKDALDEKHVQAAEKSAERIEKELPNQTDLTENVAAVSFGAGKDSSWLLSYVRLVQLLIAEKHHGQTFRLRTFTGQQPGMDQHVMDNADRIFDKLGMKDDPLVQSYLVQQHNVIPFDKDAKLPDDIREMARKDMLLSANRSGGEGRTSFCHACNAYLVNWIAQGASYAGGADLVFTGDSMDEMKQYWSWIQLVAKEAGISKGDLIKMKNELQDKDPHQYLGKLLFMVDGIYRQHFGQLHGKDSAFVDAHSIPYALPKISKFTSVFKEVEYKAEDHLDFLNNFLKFDFNSYMSSFTETDCGNPMLMAHMSGLATEHVQGRTYAEGVREHLQGILPLMERKHMPGFLIEMMKERYDTPEKIEHMRKVAEDYALENYRATDQQLVCAVWSPFANEGQYLEGYLRHEAPDLADGAHIGLIRDYISAAREPREHGAALVHSLEEMSGLTLAEMRRTWHQKLQMHPLERITPGSEAEREASAMLKGDNHQVVANEDGRQINRWYR